MVIMFIVTSFWFTKKSLTYSSRLEIKSFFLNLYKMSTWIFIVVFLVSSVFLRTALQWKVGFYSSRGCIFPTLVFDWGSINISRGWGCIQEWGSNQADTVITNKKVIKLWNFGNFGIPKIIPKTLVTLRFSKILLQCLKVSVSAFKWGIDQTFMLIQPTATLVFSKLANGEFYCKAL